MNKPSLRDRRRQEARDALYRAQERRDRLIAALVRNDNHMKTLRRTLKRLDLVTVNTISVLPLSVAKGELLEPVEVVVADPLSDPVPELGAS